jgi:hypothetical protein
LNTALSNETGPLKVALSKSAELGKIKPLKSKGTFALTTNVFGWEFFSFPPSGSLVSSAFARNIQAEKSALAASSHQSSSAAPQVPAFSMLNLSASLWLAQAFQLALAA